MRICVTGGAGFIGSHLVDRLINDGHTVLVIDNLSSGSRKFINSKAQFIEMDIRDSNLSSTICEFKPEYIFHEAAQTEVSVSMNNPKLDCDVNLMGLINVLDAAVTCGVKKLLMPSSAAIYGNLDTLPLDESMIGMPTSFYGLTKLTTEHYLRIYYEAHGLNYICYRYSNVYGPRQGNGGEGGVISIFNRLIVEGKPLTVYGDGEQTRDFIYVEDVVEANIKAMGNTSCTGIYNVSTNTGTSVNELITRFRSISGADFMVHYEDERIGDIKHSRLSNAKAERDFGFVASTTLDEGLQKTLEYFKAHHK